MKKRYIPALRPIGRDGDDDEGDCGEEDASDEKTKSEMFCSVWRCAA